MRAFWRLRLHVKLLLRRYRCIDSFCKRCGKRVIDFAAPDELWQKVAADIEAKGMHTLCFDCFTESGREKGLFDVLYVSRGEEK